MQFYWKVVAPGGAIYETSIFSHIPQDYFWPTIILYTCQNCLSSSFCPSVDSRFVMSTYSGLRMDVCFLHIWHKLPGSLKGKPHEPLWIAYNCPMEILALLTRTFLPLEFTLRFIIFIEIFIVLNVVNCFILTPLPCKRCQCRQSPFYLTIILCPINPDFITRIFQCYWQLKGNLYFCGWNKRDRLYFNLPSVHGS